MNNERYSRQTVLPEIGPEGQARLAEAAVLIVGAGGLGSPVALYLAAMGVGRIGLVDGDRVELSNLHRQVVYATRDVGRPKVEAAAERLEALNPLVHIERHPFDLIPENALELIRGYDVVADGTDAFATRYLVNDACLVAGVPNVFASVNRFEGQASVFGHPDGPCYRCLFPVPPAEGTVPSCAEGGILGVLPGLMGMIQATETAKLLLRIGETLVGRLLVADAAGMRFRTVAVERDPACPACGAGERIRNLATFAADYESICEPRMSSDAIPEMTVGELHALQARGEAPFLLDVRQPEEYAAGNLGGELIPLGELPERLGELDGRRDELVVVHCRTGSRSARAVEFLRANGFPKVVNLRGGVRAWALEIDPALHVA